MTMQYSISGTRGGLFSGQAIVISKSTFSAFSALFCPTTGSLQIDPGLAVCGVGGS